MTESQFIANTEIVEFMLIVIVYRTRLVVLESQKTCENKNTDCDEIYYTYRVSCNS